MAGLAFVMQHLLDDLNEAQQRAVTHPGGPLLVIAGAGSGKTRVITRRIAWLLSQGVPEWGILGVTFTNKAAREMAERVQSLIPDTRIRLSTFHSACAAFLRRSAPRLGFTNDFTIYDQQDREQLVKQVMRDLQISPKEVRPSVISSRISKLKNDGLWPDDYQPDPYVPLARMTGRVYGPYQEALAAMNAMDFDDLLLFFLRLLDDFEDERDRYSSRFRHLLVDEFQDTNAIQYRIVRRLSEVHGNLCVVGDPDQSIYSFRGAEIDNILSFPQDFENCEVVKLETNYRSSATILDFAQKVIANNALRFDKVLEPALPPGDPVQYLPCDSGRAEAQECAYQVRSLLDRGISPNEIAVFYRARFLSRGLEDAFRRLALPFEIVGDVGFFGRKEIKDLLAYLQVTVNPRDAVSFLRILNVPPRGIGKVSVERIQAEADRQGLTVGELVMATSEIEGLSAKAKKGLRELGGLLVEAQVLGAESVERALNLILERSDYIEAICKTGSFKDVDRQENVQELLVFARAFDRELAARVERGDEREHAVATFLTDVSLQGDATEQEVDAPRAQLMTVHAAKGLEFDHVFVLGLEENVFPHAQSLESKDDLEEERRLFYVATTRARKTLAILRAEFRESYDRGPQQNPPSRFLKEAGLEIGKKRWSAADYGDDRVGAESEDGEAVYRYESAGNEREREAVNTSFAVGEWVHHETYGDGKVLRCFGSGSSAKAEVMFSSGVRTLLLEYARLVRVSS